MYSIVIIQVYLEYREKSEIEVEKEVEKFLKNNIEILNPDEAPPIISPTPCTDYREYLLQQCRWFNESKGEDDGTGVECSECKNKGYIQELDSECNSHIVECDCMTKRRSIHALQRSGLAEQAKRQTFDSFNTDEEWQKKAKAKALLFLRESHTGKWFYIGGQSGCGKTHLCTAICSRLINIGREVHYVVWFNLLHELQSLQFKEEYKKRLQDYQDCDVLYIDDFLKDVEAKTKSQLKSFAYEVINARYISGKTTIISSEFHIDVLKTINKAIAGRIEEKARDHIVQIKYVAGRDQREKASQHNDEK